MLTLHLTNGDAAAAMLARSGLPGDIVSWRDALHDGPVPPDDDAVAFHHARAAFLAARGWSDEHAIREDLAQRDARLDDVQGSDEVVLWFEPDLYDQLQLIQILARLRRRAPAQRPRITIAPADCYLGPMLPEKFLPLFAARRTVQLSDLDHGAAAWAAFTAETPDDLPAVMQQLDRDITARTYAADEAVRLPHLTAALRRQLEEYPDGDAGLSRSERQLCEALQPGAITLAKLFAAHQRTESWIWLGDTTFAWYAERLSDCAHPIVVHTNGSRVIAPRPGADARDFWERSVMLTPFGQDVVRARADAVQANGIDRWIGGTRCTTARHWRWDARVQRTVPSPTTG